MPRDAGARGFDDAFWQALAHEMRTSLNHVCGGVELVLEGAAGPVSADVRAALGDVALAARRLFGVTDTLLALAATGTPPDGHDLFAAVRAAAEAAVGAARVRVQPPGALDARVRSTPALVAQLGQAAVATRLGDGPVALALRAREADGLLWVELAQRGRRERSDHEAAAWAAAVGRQICVWLGVVWREGAHEIALGVRRGDTLARD